MTTNFFTKMRLPAACLLLWIIIFAADARGLVCDICGEPITGEFYTAKDKVTGEKTVL